jgi:hypothetical protein
LFWARSKSLAVILVEREASLKRFFEERQILPFGGFGNIC